MVKTVTSGMGNHKAAHSLDSKNNHLGSTIPREQLSRLRASGGAVSQKPVTSTGNQNKSPSQNKEEQLVQSTSLKGNISPTKKKDQEPKEA
jgi:hypothetical protein